jgi:hypothetical protein
MVDERTERCRPLGGSKYPAGTLREQGVTEAKCGSALVGVVALWVEGQRVGPDDLRRQGEGGRLFGRLSRQKENRCRDRERGEDEQSREESRSSWSSGS